jgi:hypothetical protein
LKNLRAVDKQVLVSRIATCIIIAGVLAHLVGTTLYFFTQHSPAIITTQPTFQGIIVGLLTAAAIFRGAGYFHERTARNIMRYVGIAIILETASYAFRNFLAGISSLMFAGGGGILVLYGCVAHLKRTARKQTIYILQQSDREFSNEFLALGFATGLGVAILPFMMNLVPLITPSSEFSVWASRIWGVGFFLSGCIVTLLGPVRSWRLGFAIGLGLPAVLLFRLAVLVFTDLSSPNLMPNTSVMSIVLGPAAAFTGVFLALTIKSFSKRRD